MDTWAWVRDLRRELIESGHVHVARLMSDLPELALDNDPRVDAVVPELLAASKALGNPWLGVYTRHWYLQCRVNRRNEGTTALHDAVEALELAHRPDTIDCPQGVCATQDLSLVYEMIDNIGHAADRESIARETLARVDATWNCFDCLHRELCHAIADQGRVSEAISLCEQSVIERSLVGEEPSEDYVSLQAKLQRLAGNYDEAKSICEEAAQKRESIQHTTKVTRGLEWTAACRLLGDYAGALEHLPSVEDVLSAKGSGQVWGSEVLALVEVGVYENTAELGRVVQLLLDSFVNGGSTRPSMELGIVHSTLALKRGTKWLAELALVEAESASRQLRSTSDAERSTLTKLRGEIDALAEMASPVPLDEVAEYVLTSESSAEQDVAWLLQATKHNPHDAPAAFRLGMAYCAIGMEQRALDYFVSLASSPVRSELEYVGVLQNLLRTDLPRSAVDAAVEQVSAQLLSTSESQTQFVGHRMRAELSWHRLDSAATIEHCRACLAIEPDAPVTRQLLADALVRNGDFHAALDELQPLVEAEAEPGQATWTLMIAATCIEDWQMVRTLGASLDMEFDNDSGPIDERWHGVSLLIADPDGDRNTWAGVRTGPVTARILEVSHPGREQQVFDRVVVFNPSALNTDDQEEAGEDWIPMFKVMHELSPSTFRSWIVDGPYPGEELWADFRDTLREAGWGCWSAGWGGYSVYDSEAVNTEAVNTEAVNTDDASDEGSEGQELPGLYCFVAAPSELEPSTVYKRIDELTAQWPHRPSFLALAEAAEIEVQRHEAIVDRFSL
jgi:tetratricopeptide (TPR) repeat protein